MTHANGRYPSKHVQITLALVIEQPLHFALVQQQRFLVHLSLREHVLRLHRLCSFVRRTLRKRTCFISVKKKSIHKVFYFCTKKYSVLCFNRKQERFCSNKNIIVDFKRLVPVASSIRIGWTNVTVKKPKHFF